MPRADDEIEMLFQRLRSSTYALTGTRQLSCSLRAQGHLLPDVDPHLEASVENGSESEQNCESRQNWQFTD